MIILHVVFCINGKKNVFYVTQSKKKQLLNGALSHNRPFHVVFIWLEMQHLNHEVPNMSSQEIIKHVPIVLASMQCNVQNGFTAFNQHNGLLGKTFGRYRTEKLVFALM